MADVGELRLVRAEDCTGSTAQTENMVRTAGVSESTAGSRGIFMGNTVMGPATRSGAHHHGESETAIYVVSGTPAFIFRRGDEEVRLETKPGDFVYVPPFVPHIEENRSDDTNAVLVLARTTQEAIVENVASL